MSQETSSSYENGREHISAFWPLILISVGFILLMGYQLTIILVQRGSLQTAIKQQTEAVNQSIRMQNELQRVAGELLTLADTDSDARAVVNKYKISRNAPQPSAPEGQPAPAANK